MQYREIFGSASELHTSRSVIHVGHLLAQVPSALRTPFQNSEDHWHETRGPGDAQPCKWPFLLPSSPLSLSSEKLNPVKNCILGTIINLGKPRHPLQRQAQTSLSLNPPPPSAQVNWPPAWQGLGGEGGRVYPGHPREG